MIGLTDRIASRGKNKSQLADGFVSIPMTLSDLERGQNLLADLHNYARMV